MRPELEVALELARELDAADLPYFLGELETVRVMAQARLASPPVPAPPDQLLDCEQAAARLHLSKDYIYRHSAKFGARRIGRALRFSSAGLDAYLKKSR